MMTGQLRHAFSPRRNRAVLRHLVRRGLADRRGVAAVEFAMIMPALVAAYLGVVEVTQAVMVDRKVTLLNRALADLTAQSAALNATDVSSIFDAALSVMTPYRPAPARMMLASVVIDAGGVPRVCWSDHRNSVALARGSLVNLPTDLRVPNTSVIMAQASYDFDPVVGSAIIGTIRIGDTPIYMRPRAGRTGGTGSVEQVERTGASPPRPMCPGF